MSEDKEGDGDVYVSLRIPRDDYEKGKRLLRWLSDLWRNYGEARRQLTGTVEKDWRAVVREVIDLLDSTRHTFKSKQIQRAKQLLLDLLGESTPKKGDDDV